MGDFPPASMKALHAGKAEAVKGLQAPFGQQPMSVSSFEWGVCLRRKPQLASKFTIGVVLCCRKWLETNGCCGMILWEVPVCCLFYFAPLYFKYWLVTEVVRFCKFVCGESIHINKHAWNLLHLWWTDFLILTSYHHLQVMHGPLSSLAQKTAWDLSQDLVSNTIQIRRYDCCVNGIE